MQVVAKFRCVEKHETHNASSDPNPVAVRFVPTFDESGPNKSWSKYTPNGEFKMTITNPSAAAEFEVGVEYMITFDRAKAAE